MLAGQGVEADLGKLSAIIITDDGVGDSQAMDVSHNTFQSLSTGIVSNDHSCVSHQLGWKIYITTQLKERIQSHIKVSISLASHALSLNTNYITITLLLLHRYLRI